MPTLVDVSEDLEAVSEKELMILALPVNYVQSARAGGFEPKKDDPRQAINFASLWNAKLGVELDVSAVGERPAWYARAYQPDTGKSAMLDLGKPFSLAAMMDSLEKIE